MALNPTSDEKLEDISFINKKRSPKMKPPSDVKSPFAQIGNDEPVPVTLTKSVAIKVHENKTDIVPNTSSHLQHKIDSSELNIIKSKSKKSTLEKSERTTPYRPERTYKHIELSKETFQSMINQLGPEKASYALLLKMASCNQDLVSISYKESSALFGLKSEKSAKIILTSLEKEGIITVINKANISESKPSTYHIEF